jgi:hypothetical protein
MPGGFQFRVLHGTTDKFNVLDQRQFVELVPKNTLFVLNWSGLLPPRAIARIGRKMTAVWWVHVLADLPGPSTLAVPPGSKPGTQLVLPGTKVTLSDPYPYSGAPLAAGEVVHWRNLEVWLAQVENIDAVPIQQSINGEFTEGAQLTFRAAQSEFCAVNNLSLRLHTSARLSRELLQRLLGRGFGVAFADVRTSLGRCDEGGFLPEWAVLTEGEARKIDSAVKSGKTIVPVGLEVVRLLTKQYTQFPERVGTFHGWVETIPPGTALPHWLKGFLCAPALETGQEYLLARLLGDPLWRQLLELSRESALGLRDLLFYLP